MATSPRSENGMCTLCGATEGEKHSPTCAMLKEFDELHMAINVRLPPEVMPYRVELQRFIDAMVHKLKVHHKKGKWENMPMHRAVGLLKGEVDELVEAINGGNMVEILLESADVANFGLIVSAIAVEKK